jgi:hypothetical protein
MGKEQELMRPTKKSQADDPTKTATSRFNAAYILPLSKKEQRLTPEQAVEIFGQEVLEIVVYNLCSQFLKLFDLKDRILAIEYAIPTLPVDPDHISLRGIYEATLPHLKRDKYKAHRHITFLGRCYDLLTGTRTFGAKAKPRYSNQESAAQIKERVNIADVVSRDIELKLSGRTFKARCPFHNDKTPSFVVYPDEGRWWCFACNFGGDVISYVQQSRNCSFPEALAELQKI